MIFPHFIDRKSLFSASKAAHSRHLYIQPLTVPDHQCLCIFEFQPVHTGSINIYVQYIRSSTIIRVTAGTHKTLNSFVYTYTYALIYVCGQERKFYGIEVDQFWILYFNNIFRWSKRIDIYVNVGFSQMLCTVTLQTNTHNTIFIEKC